jgi:hypothetical protein
MRIFDMIKSELNADKLKAEEELERVINDKSLETNDKVVTIKKLLREVTQIELSFEKWKTYITGDETENNKK